MTKFAAAILITTVASAHQTQWIASGRPLNETGSRQGIEICEGNESMSLVALSEIS